MPRRITSQSIAPCRGSTRAAGVLRSNAQRDPPWAPRVVASVASVVQTDRIPQNRQKTYQNLYKKKIKTYQTSRFIHVSKRPRRYFRVSTSTSQDPTRLFTRLFTGLFTGLFTSSHQISLVKVGLRRFHSRRERIEPSLHVKVVTRFMISSYFSPCLFLTKARAASVR